MGLYGLPIHKIIRGAINAVSNDEDLVLYRAVGEERRKGSANAKYFAPINVKGNVQYDANKVTNADNVQQLETTRRIYLSTDSYPEEIPTALSRQLARSGDFIFRPFDQCWWKITEDSEDWNNVNWVCVRVVRQTIPPDFSYSDWYIDENQNG